MDRYVNKFWMGLVARGRITNSNGTLGFFLHPSFRVFRLLRYGAAN
jgi:hypothetical protein